MSKIIALFNHKGGVSKTTTTFHLGWMMAELGKRVLLIDADPQCNLTGLALGIEDYDGLSKFYNSRQNNDIYNSLAGFFGLENNATNLDAGVSTQKTKNDNLHILPGHMKFANFDLQLATALTSSESLPILKPLLGSINKLIRNTALKGDFDLVLIDMSPSISATNMCIFMASDYFIIPTSPDFYCYQAIDSLREVLPKWSEKMKSFKDGITLPKDNPKMLGVVCQNYRTYASDKKENDMSKEFKRWADKIKNITNDTLVPALNENNMVIGVKAFEEFVTADIPYNLANIRNFNALIPISQKLSKPMFFLTKEDGGWGGATWERVQNNKAVGAKYAIEDALSVYKSLAVSVCGMIGETINTANQPI